MGKWLAIDVKMALLALVASRDIEAIEVLNFERGRGMSQRTKLLVQGWMDDNEKAVQAEVAKTEEELELIFAEQGIRRRPRARRPAAEWNF